jgi:hypothetical protein
LRSSTLGDAMACVRSSGYPTSLWRPVRAIADRKATAMSAGTECSSGIHATAVSASRSLKVRPVSAEQRPAATNPVSGRGLGGQPGGSNTTDLAENEFGLLAAIVSLLREFGAARSIVCNRWSFRLVATPAEIEPRGVLIVTRLDRLARSTRGKRRRRITAKRSRRQRR